MNKNDCQSNLMTRIFSDCMYLCKNGILISDIVMLLY